MNANYILDLFKEFLHIPAYAGLTFLWIMTLRMQEHKNTKAQKIMFLSFIISVSYGILNEFVQLHVPGREFSTGDMMRNALGAGIVLLIFYKKFCHFGSNEKIKS